MAMVVADPRHTPAWTPDGASPSCELCGQVFRFYRRRHHCRNCGVLCCWRCSRSRWHKGTFPTTFGLNTRKEQCRVCDRCTTSMDQFVDACMNMTATEVAPHLDRCTATLPLPGQAGRTAFHLAAAHGRLGTLRLLHARCNGVVATRDEDGATPLELAVARGHQHIVAFLLQCGGSLETVNNITVLKSLVRIAHTLAPPPAPAPAATAGAVVNTATYRMDGNNMQGRYGVGTGLPHPVGSVSTISIGDCDGKLAPPPYEATSSPAPKTACELFGDECTICLDEEATHAMVPCGHIVACAACVSACGDSCPICRKPATSTMKLFRS